MPGTPDGYRNVMTHIERTLTVDQPAERVWDYLSDFRSTNDWDPGTVRTERTSGDGGAGTTYHHTSRFLGREVQLDYVVTEVEPGRRITLQGDNSTVTSVDTITVDAAPEGGTVVTYRAELTLKGVARLAGSALALPLKKLGDDAEKGLTEALEKL
jgi:uncharacterized protein YndB with AHSA1/START domain